jgi:hypothetical protein
MRDEGTQGRNDNDMSTNHGTRESWEQQERERHRRQLRRELLGLILNYELAEIRTALNLYERDPKQFSGDVMQEMEKDAVIK